MSRFDTWRRSVALGALLVPTLAAAAPTTVAPASRPVPAAPVATAPALPDATRITAAEVELSNQKIRSAYGALVQLWGGAFADVGARFVRPDLVRYRGVVRSGCGPMQPNNAGYCMADNTIYFDDVFVASQAKLIGQRTGTDGDMAAVGIIAHEMGHAVAMQLGHRWRDSYRNEQAADCLAGAFAKSAEASGLLDDGDVDEAFHGMAAAGDPTPQFTGDERVDRVIKVRMARMAHGTDEQRVENFRAGLEQGPSACLADFR